MSVLTKKLRRDLLANWGILLTVIAIIAVGAGLYIALRTAQRILQASQAAYYAQYHFADFWMDVKKAPLTAAEPVARVPGVAEVQTRIVFDIILDLPDVVQPLTGRLISVPADHPRETINALHLVRGSWFSPDRDNEVIVAEDFAHARRLGPGDHIRMVLNRRLEPFVIVGTAISPEYVYMVRGEGDFIPDPQHFGVLYIKEDYARQILGFQQAFNQVVGTVLPGFAGDTDLLLAQLSARLDPYGVLATTPRSRQASHRFLSDEIAGLGVSAVLMPSIFLTVAALVLNIVTGRFAEHQRTIIGTLKAMGYSDREILIHFLSFGLVIGVLGGLLSIVIGLELSDWIIRMYSTFFQFPAYLNPVYPDLLIFGIAVSVLFAVAGTIRGVRSVLKLSPAEAMRGRPPEYGGAIALERFRGLWTRLGFRSHMALRSLFRNRARTITGIIAAGLASAIILSTVVVYDSTWFIVHFQFDRVAHGDINLALRDEEPALAALAEIRRLPGVDRSEPVLSLVCDARHGRHGRRLSIMGLAPGHQLTTPIQANFQPVAIPPVGLVLTQKLADLLAVRPGDRVDLTPVRGRRQTLAAPVAAVVESFLGLDAYADIRYLSRLVGHNEILNAVQLRVNSPRTDDLFAAVKQLPNVQGIAIRRQAKANIEATFIKSMTFTLGLTVVFAGIIAFGALLNASLIEIFDRRQQVSTFHVMGYRFGRIAGIFWRENLIVFLAGLILSVPVGWLLAIVIAERYNTELFRLPVIFRFDIVALSLLTMVVFLVIVQAVVYRQIAKTDFLEAIKVKE